VAPPSVIPCPACATPAARLVFDLDGDQPPPLPRCTGCGAPRLTVGWRAAPSAFVVLAPAPAVCDWRSLERVAERAFWRALAVAPTPLKRDPDRCLRRVVFGAIAAREKLTIWRAGFDDAVVECLKLDLRLRVPRLRAHPEADLRLVDVTDGARSDGEAASDGETLCFATTQGAGLRVPRRRLDQLAADRAALAHRWPALFAGPFVDHLRLRE
jgi:hypothetical protein